MSERVILAYSGGLDTSVAISWIGKETGREVVAVAIDLGQGGEDMEVVRQRALDCGAVEAVVGDEQCVQLRLHGTALAVLRGLDDEDHHEGDHGGHRRDQPHPTDVVEQAECPEDDHGDRQCDGRKRPEDVGRTGHGMVGVMVQAPPVESRHVLTP